MLGLYEYFMWLICKKIMQKQPPELLYKKVVLENFEKFLRKHLYQSL